MSVANTYLAAPDATSDAVFRIWGSAIANAIANCGWVKNTDAAQINWTTVTVNISSTQQVAGYEVWHMNDTGAGANQASNPVFMKFEYGNGALSSPSLWVTLGTTCNSSGGLGGAISSRQKLETSKNANTSAISVYSGDVNRFHLAAVAFSTNTTSNVVSTSATGSLLSIERTKDASGNDTNEGILLIMKAGLSAVYTQQYLNLTAGPTGIESWGALMPTANIQFSTGIQTAVYPLYLSKGVFLNPGMGVLCVDSRLVSEMQTMSVPIYGANHTYMCFGNVMFNTTITRAGAASTCMLRWE
jgi:hypothetical protein